eukprot:353323-Chlamydomonas_euryale.AAC.6
MAIQLRTPPPAGSVNIVLDKASRGPSSGSSLTSRMSTSFSGLGKLARHALRPLGADRESKHAMRAQLAELRWRNEAAEIRLGSAKLEIEALVSVLCASRDGTTARLRAACREIDAITCVCSAATDERTAAEAACAKPNAKRSTLQERLEQSRSQHRATKAALDDTSVTLVHVQDSHSAEAQTARGASDARQKAAEVALAVCQRQCSGAEAARAAEATARCAAEEALALCQEQLHASEAARVALRRRAHGLRHARSACPLDAPPASTRRSC